MGECQLEPKQNASTCVLRDARWGSNCVPTNWVVLESVKTHRPLLAANTHSSSITESAV